MNHEDFPGEQEMMIPTPPPVTPEGQDPPPGPVPSRKGPLGWIVAGSLVIGVIAAVLLAVAPFVPATESGVTGSVLVGLAVGWAMLPVLSTRFTDQRQTWAVVPALFMGSGGFLLVVFGAPMREVLAWVWPPALLVLAAWMILKVHRQLRSRGGRLLLYPVMAVLVLASLGGGYETVREAMHTKARPEQGQLIDVGGHRLYLECTGSGSPTVVLEPGAGNMSSDLVLITPVVARETRVCIYDRAGRGWSDPANTPQDGARIAADLHTLLHRADEPGPYVLAGHSFGGLYALTFAADYPQDVAGLVLVDSTAPASTPATSSATGPPTSTGPDPDDTMDRVAALVTSAARLGVGRLLGAATPDHLWSTIDEYMQGKPSMQQAAALSSFADRPLIVLTADSGSQPGWNASQEALAALSTNKAHRVIDGSTHASLIGDPKGAAATSQGILDVVSAVRTASPLTPLDSADFRQAG